MERALLMRRQTPNSIFSLPAVQVLGALELVFHHHLFPPSLQPLWVVYVTLLRCGLVTECQAITGIQHNTYERVSSSHPIIYLIKVSPPPPRQSRWQNFCDVQHLSLSLLVPVDFTISHNEKNTLAHSFCSTQIRKRWSFYIVVGAQSVSSLPFKLTLRITTLYVSFALFFIIYSHILIHLIHYQSLKFLSILPSVAVGILNPRSIK